MATEGHMGGQGKDHQQKNKVEIDKELTEIREKMERLALKMQQDAKVHWTYEWPLKRKVKWPVQKLMSRRQQQMLKRWLRHAKNLSDTEEEVVHICEPETGKSLSDNEDKRSVDDLKDCQKGNSELSDCQVGNDMRLAEDFINCQEGRNGLSSCQVGNGKRSVGGLIYCQRSSNESSDCQVGNEMGSLEDLIDCQESRRKIPSCPGGQGK
jgi:hypothetical protein